MTEKVTYESSNGLDPENSEAVRTSAVCERMLGDGDMPTELNRFSWGSFFLPLIWALRYWVWRPLFVLLALLSAAVLSRGLTANFLLGVVPVSGLLTPLLGVAVTAYALWLGVNGNRLAWQAAARRVARGRREPTTVAGVLKGQKYWIAFGAVFELLAAADLCRSILLKSGLDRVEAGVALGIQLVALAAALYLSHAGGQLRRNSIAQ